MNVGRPSPEPAFPAGFDPFLPPVSSIQPVSGAPAIAEWTKTGMPDSVIALTGKALSSFTDATAGKDTQFQVFGQTAGGSFYGAASILRQDGLKAAVILPVGLPANSEYLIWPVNSVGVGSPVAVNATEAWWVGPKVATRGDSVSVFGRNLAHTTGTTMTSHVYIQKSGMAGVWATVTAANPYKVDFTVPANLANGDYQVWTHNGHGGHYGWSGPQTLTINNGMPWSTQIFNVMNYGAKGDGVTDDEAAIEKTRQAAAMIPWSTIYLPTGTYMVSRGFAPDSQERWMGDGPTKTYIKANSGFTTPAAYDSRRYCLFFNDWGVNSIKFQDMTIDANGDMKGYLGTVVHMRSATDIRFANVTINAKGCAIGDFHLGNLLSFENCDLIGGGNGMFFGTATQVFIDNCRVYGTNDANTLLTWWGGDGMSCTNTTAQDYDNTQPDGWAQGRFFYGSSAWGSNRNIYVGDSTTRALAVRPGFSNQNTGEQLLWESGTKYSGKPNFASNTTVTFGNSAFFGDPGLHTGSWDAVIVNGTGLGQHRKIVSCAGTTITVSPAWNVPPDNTSTVLIAGVVSQCAIYHNSLQGKGVTASRPTASAGIQPYGNGFDFIADNNTISQVQTGIYLWSMNQADLQPQSISCTYFNYVAHNTITNCVNGIVGVSQAWSGWPASAPYPGISYLGNTCIDNTVTSMSDNGLALWANTPPSGDQLELNVYEQNTVTSTATGLDLETNNQINNTIAYKNNLSLGSAPARGSIGLAMSTSAKSALRLNQYTGFESTYATGLTPAQTLDAPAHVISIQGTPRGQPVTTSLTLWNTGPVPVTWKASSNASWLTASQATGSLSNESSAAQITLSCNPSKLAAGIYTGSITVTAGTESRTYDVNFTVAAAAPTAPTKALLR